jgi:dimethylhistidine N-methyltransferase
MEQQAKSNTNFAADIREGLSSSPKVLSSKYFYDDEGSRLFQEIMALPEYYVTRAELEIFSTQTAEICEAFKYQGLPFDLIELGAGDGTKTAFLIEYLLDRNIDFNYVPIDISEEAISILTKKFERSFPMLSMVPQMGDYFQILENLKSAGGRRKIILFLGSSIGNFLPGEQEIFFKKLEKAINKEDRLLIGFDLQKDPKTILRAYDDEKGVTARFNLNLLERINRELGGNFDLSNFSHFAVYSPIEGAAKSFLISRAAQSVFIEELGLEFSFARWEPIFMEISQKYSLKMIENISETCSFRIERNFFDSNDFFTNSLWAPV